MVLLFSVLVLTIFTALGMAPVSMLICRVMTKEKPRFEQAFSMCFYASGSIWLVYSLIAMYFGEESIVAPIIAGFVVGYFLFVVLFRRMYMCSVRRSMMVSLVLIVATIGVFIVEMIGFTAMLMLYGSITLQ